MAEKETITLTVSETTPKEVRDALLAALPEKSVLWWTSLATRILNTVRDRMT